MLNLMINRLFNNSFFITIIRTLPLVDPFWKVIPLTLTFPEAAIWTRLKLLLPFIMQAPPAQLKLKAPDVFAWIVEVIVIWAFAQIKTLLELLMEDLSPSSLLTQNGATSHRPLMQLVHPEGAVRQSLLLKHGLKHVARLPGFWQNEPRHVVQPFSAPLQLASFKHELPQKGLMHFLPIQLEQLLVAPKQSLSELQFSPHWGWRVQTFLTGQS